MGRGENFAFHFSTSWGMCSIIMGNGGSNWREKNRRGSIAKKTIGWMTAAAKARETPARFFISKADSFLFPPADTLTLNWPKPVFHLGSWTACVCVCTMAQGHLFLRHCYPSPTWTHDPWAPIPPIPFLCRAREGKGCYDHSIHGNKNSMGLCHRQSKQSKIAGKRIKLYVFILMSNMLAQRKRFNFSRKTSKDALIPRVDTQAFSTSFFSSSPSIPPPQRSGDKCPIKQRRKRGEKEKGGVEEKTWDSPSLRHHQKKGKREEREKA